MQDISVENVSIPFGIALLNDECSGKRWIEKKLEHLATLLSCNDSMHPFALHNCYPLLWVPSKLLMGEA